jgi:HEAT repeat protein
MRAVAIVILLGGAMSPATAQTSRLTTDAQLISRGWTALAAGQLTEAVSFADSVLKRKPHSHAALTLKIEAVSAGEQPLNALDAYEAWMPKGGHNVEDRGLLQPIATGVLRVLSKDPDPLVQIAAIEWLAKVGDDRAVDTLQKRSAAGDTRAALALVETSDHPEAIASLQRFVASANGRDASAAIGALAEHGSLTPTALQQLAQDRAPMNKAAVARALVQSNDPDAARLLESLSHDPDPFIRTSITLARARSGDEASLTQARGMLASEVPDVRLTAAEALFTTLPQESEQSVRPLLNNRDGIYRFRAAAIVGRSDPAAVQAVLIEGLSDDNPLIQQESARIATETLSEDLALMRQLLRHADRLVVVRAAGAIIHD